VEGRAEQTPGEGQVKKNPGEGQAQEDSIRGSSRGPSAETETEWVAREIQPGAVRVSTRKLIGQCLLILRQTSNLT
jgi:hypothetical protein